MSEKKHETLRDMVEAAYEKTNETESETEQDKEIPSSSNGDSNSTDVEDTTTEGTHEKSSESPEHQEEIEAPAHWAAEDVDVFNELDSKGKKLYLKRHKEMEAGYTKKTQALAEEKKIAERFKKAIEPYQPFFKQHNLDEFEAFQKAASAHIRLINASPQEKSLLIQKLALDYGVNIAQKNFDQPEQPQIDHQTQAIYDELNRTRQYIAAQEQEKQNREIASIEKQIQNFSSEKDESGELKYPYFEELRGGMGKLIQSGLASSLEEAYENAISLNKELRTQYELSQDNKRKREEANKQKMLASKKAAFNVKSGSVSQISDPKQKLSTRELLSRAYDAQIRI